MCVVDRGMTGRGNMGWLQEAEGRYGIGAARGELKNWDRQLREQRNWQEVREGVEVKICRGPEGKEVFLLCRSSDRAVKEKAMHQRFSQRIEAGLASLSRRIERSKRSLEKGKLERQVGRLLQRNSRAAGRYTIHFHDDPSSKAGVRLQWTLNPQWEQWASYSEGCYILRTNITEWTPEALWKTYVQLTDAEAAFRVHKSDLSIRPR